MEEQEEQHDSQNLRHENLRLQQELEELQETNKELLVYKQQLDAILNNAPVEVYLKDREGRYLRINKQFEKIFDVKNEELIGLLPTDIHDSELGESTRQQDLFVLNSGKANEREELAMLANDDREHTLLTIKFPVFNDEGDVDGLGAIVTDITDRKLLEESLRRSQKMDAIGQLTGGIAHDFNNILGIIMGNLEILEPYVKHDEHARMCVESAYKGASRGAELTRNLLGFARTSAGTQMIVSLNKFISGMESLITKSLTVSIKINMQLNENLWSVKIDPGELEDTILNLSLNARDAMPAGGAITIKTSNVSIDEEYVRDHPLATTGEFVMLSVNDNGQGMTSDICIKCTEPFFTTKKTGKGTGLGLSMVYGFVKRSGGHMNILSEPGKGTSVNLYLPRVIEHIDNDASSEDVAFGQHTRFQHGRETILVVDDEQALVDIATSNLHDLGYKTVQANNSKQALNILKSNDTIDLLFADVIMPGEMDGYELALSAQKLYPSLKILMSSGYSNRNDEFVDNSGVKRSTSQYKLLKKPYNKSKLSAHIRQALDSETEL